MQIKKDTEIPLFTHQSSKDLKKRLIIYDVGKALGKLASSNTDNGRIN